MIIFLWYVDTMLTEQYEDCNASGRQLQLQLNAILIQAINTFKKLEKFSLEVAPTTTRLIL